MLLAALVSVCTFNLMELLANRLLCMLSEHALEAMPRERVSQQADRRTN